MPKQTKELSAVDRLGLARRLHETLAQDLAAIGYQLDALIAEESMDAASRAELRRIRLQVMRTNQGFREEIYRLRQIDRHGLEQQIKLLLSPAECHLDFAYPPLPEHVEQCLNQALLEIARNSAKHSGATVFELHHSLSDQFLSIEVGDNGSGSITIKKGSFGLRVIDESLSQIAAEYSCRSDSSGTFFTIQISRKLLN